MKDDELALWQAFGVGDEAHRFPRYAAQELGINRKRCDYLCHKWSKRGIYDYGVTCDMGWKVSANP